MGKSPTWNQESLMAAVASSSSMAGVCRFLGLVYAGGTYSNLKRNIERLSLDTSHWTGRAWNKGLFLQDRYTEIPLEAILVENSNYRYGYLLKDRLVREGFMTPKCHKCGGRECWQGEHLTLQLHHINGIRNDNRRENLELLCPNCHSQTKNWGNKKG